MVYTISAVAAHRAKWYRTSSCLYKGAGIEFRILPNGEIIERYTGKIRGITVDQDIIDELSRLKGLKLDAACRKLI